MPKVIEIDVRPKRLMDRQWTLYEWTYFDQVIFTPHAGRIQKSTKRVWPLIKQPNGYGMRFFTAKEAMKYFLTFKNIDIVEGTMLHKRLRRMKLI